MTKNKLPFSNQFERGHSFNWAGKWTEGKYYLNDEYVTDFVICDSMLLRCRENHMASNENKPTPILSDYKIIGMESSRYWEFIEAVGGILYEPHYDPNTGNVIWKRKSEKDSNDEIETPLNVEPVIESLLFNALNVEQHVYLSETEYENLQNKDDNVLYLIYEDEDVV